MVILYQFFIMARCSYHIKDFLPNPSHLSLSLDKSVDVNELTMYAENLGTIPPNTALMVVTDGDKRYEVRITSDTEKNGTIAFVHKKQIILKGNNYST